MAKARSQGLRLTVKKEEYEEIPKLEQLLHNTNSASKHKTKNKNNKGLIQAHIATVKSENAKYNKALLESPKETFTTLKITTVQVTKLIGYIVNDKMSVKEAARKAGMNRTTASRFYHEYQDDPEHKIPLPKVRLNKSSISVTQQNINDLIHYVMNDKMNLNQASKKAGIERRMAARYYSKYLEDPERNIPLLHVRSGGTPKYYTREEITALIGYIVRDKMTVAEASKKVNMPQCTARKYYLKYLHNPNHEIPDPSESNQRAGKLCTNDQVRSLIEYIVNDGMTLLEASIKANMNEKTARKYYNQHLNDPESNIPTPELNDRHASNNPPKVDQVKNFFCYVIIDQLSIARAARRANISENTGRILYSTYLKNPIQETTIKDMSYSEEKMKRFVELVQNKKMNLREAADAVNLNNRSAIKHYKQYLKNPLYEFPTSKQKRYTQEDIQKLIDSIEHDKMSVSSAARKIKMKITTAYRYYKEYQNDPEHKIPVPTFNGQTRKNNTCNQYARIIADIYKNNPSIKPIYGSHDRKMDGVDIKIKEELVVEDKNILLKTESN